MCSVRVGFFFSCRYPATLIRFALQPAPGSRYRSRCTHMYATHRPSVAPFQVLAHLIAVARRRQQLVYSVMVSLDGVNKPLCCTKCTVRAYLIFSARTPLDGDDPAARCPYRRSVLKGAEIRSVGSLVPRRGTVMG